MTVTDTVYAVERRTGERWAIVGETVFATREAADAFRERYAADDVTGSLRAADLRVESYDVVD